jgi:hypothetical protein
MKSLQRSKLKKEGGNYTELRKAENILDREEKHDLHYSKIVFWSAIVVIIFANLLVSLVLIPFLLFFSSFTLYFFVAVMAGTVGFLYNFLITDIGHLSQKHHLWASILIPLIAIVNIVLIVTFSNRYVGQLSVQPQNPWIISIIFAIAFIFPFFIIQIKNKISSKNKP